MKPLMWTFLNSNLCSVLCLCVGLKQLTEILKECSHVSDVEVPERVESAESKEIFDAFRKQLAENKPKKGKKKGGKKKKKKAWATHLRPRGQTIGWVVDHTWRSRWDWEFNWRDELHQHSWLGWHERVHLLSTASLFTKGTDKPHLHPSSALCQPWELAEMPLNKPKVKFARLRKTAF